MNTIGGFSSIIPGSSSLQSARFSEEKGKFDALVKKLTDDSDAGKNIASSQVVASGRLYGDYSSGFAGSFKGDAAKNALPQGAAANQAGKLNGKTIDKTSALYEKSLEMESYFVKMMMSSMRKTVMKADSKESFAKNMYEDMLYDEYATTMTKNAGFGLADQMYLQLSQGGVQA